MCEVGLIGASVWEKVWILHHVSAGWSFALAPSLLPGQLLSEWEKITFPILCRSVGRTKSCSYGLLVIHYHLQLRDQSSIWGEAHHCAQDAERLGLTQHLLGSFDIRWEKDRLLDSQNFYTQFFCKRNIL